MARFIDRRSTGKNKSAVNRQRFLRRFKKQIQKSVNTAVSKRHVTDIEAGDKVIIPANDIYEPILQHGPGGKEETIFPGNVEFVAGDHIQKPTSSEQSGGSSASNSGEGLDDFQFELSKDEFINMFFDDLALPEMIKKQLKQIPSSTTAHAGYRSYGSPNNLSIIRSLKRSLGRRIALAAPYKKKLAEAETSLKQLEDQGDSDSMQAKQFRKDIEALKAKILKIPFLETIDLRYRNYVRQNLPSTQAVMFCIMDVSGSMDEPKKEIAKRFFILLYLFLKKNYQKIDLIFIRHHTTAKEVNEDDFFYSRETGGTVVSSALELMRKIINERYPTSDWNIYGAQASDGDNWAADSPLCQEILERDILPNLQYFAYVEIKPRQHQSLWEAYLRVKEHSNHFVMQNIADITEIYPVFHDLFKRQQSS